MKTRALLCAVLAAAIVLGCAPTQFALISGAPLVVTCPRAQCDVNVFVDAYGNVTVDATQVNIKVPNTIITWHLRALPSYEFRSGHPTDSIVFKGPNATAAEQEFTGRIATGPVYRMRDTGTRRDIKFQYEIRVYKSGSDDPPKVLDPYIYNDF